MRGVGSAKTPKLIFLSCLDWGHIRHLPRSTNVVLLCIVHVEYGLSTVEVGETVSVAPVEEEEKKEKAATRRSE